MVAERQRTTVMVSVYAIEKDSSRVSPKELMG